jgi:hypothetical protein
VTTLYAPAPAPHDVGTDAGPACLHRAAQGRRHQGSRWLLVIIGLVAAATAVLTAVTKPASNHNLPHVLGNTSQLVAILLPVLGILLVTSEWSQHTPL